MRRNCAAVLLILFGVAGFALQPPVAQGAGSYLALKGGVYSPSATFNLDNVDLGTAFEADTKTGFAGEVAIGHYFLPTFALELGVGYFEAKGSFAPVAVGAPSPQMDFNVVPVIVCAKAFIPVGPISPYGELGIGAYFSKLNIDNNLNTFDGTSTFGLHAGAGLNINFAQSAFIGVEGRYVWADPSFGGQTINLNDTDYDLNGFKLNGFTTMLALGLVF
ncbi:MAG: outer membrane beta-barrel protein [Candidatus Krumholzibacteriia bacterium]